MSNNKLNIQKFTQDLIEYQLFNSKLPLEFEELGEEQKERIYALLNEYQKEWDNLEVDDEGLTRESQAQDYKLVDQLEQDILKVTGEKGKAANIYYIRINNDRNGNPRYLVSLTEEQAENAKSRIKKAGNRELVIKSTNGDYIFFNYIVQSYNIDGDLGRVAE